uniref:Uncharacterized protein n=1 Tax=Strongyloides stercoralis TaxID=6248 RepID=A0A0K0ET52_STRER
MENSNEEEVYIIKTTFDIELFKLPKRNTRTNLSSPTNGPKTNFSKMNRLKPFESNTRKYKNKDFILGEKQNKVEEKFRLEGKRAEMLEKRNKLFKKNRQIPPSGGFHLSIGSSKVKGGTIYETTSNKIYLPLIRSENIRNNIIKTVKSEDNTIECKKEVENSYFFPSKDRLKLVRQDSGIRSIIKGVGNLGFLYEKDDFKTFSRMNSFSFLDANDWTLMQ